MGASCFLPHLRGLVFVRPHHHFPMTFRLRLVCSAAGCYGIASSATFGGLLNRQKPSRPLLMMMMNFQQLSTWAIQTSAMLKMFGAAERV
jgi:hypothetical protein